MKLKIGSAPDSWAVWFPGRQKNFKRNKLKNCSSADKLGVWFPSNEKQTPWQRYLDELAEAGYEWTELGPVGYLPENPVVLRSELSKRGVKATGTFVMQHWED